jgi:CheY-like chemotaxis protein
MNSSAQPGAYVMIQVADTGPGIPPQLRDKVFEPFFTTKEIGKGTGLGLSTTLAIVKSHGGFISLYSEVGRGTRFKVYLPADLATSSAGTVPEPGSLPRGQGELVLVVDDEDAVREIARLTLERYGYRVVCASNGAEAVALYVRHQTEVAVVLTDMAMPIMDGPALIQALRAINPSVRIIGSSGLASNGGLTRAIGAGVPQFVTKPYSAHQLLTTLRAALSDAGPG